MRGHKIATAAVVAALAATGTAVAAGGGPVGGILGDDHRQEFAQDLAEQLDGVNANQVEQALEAAGEARMEEQRAAMAEAIAAELDGVNADRVAEVLADHFEQMRSALESGERPDPETGGLVTALADGLGKSEDEVRTALEAAHEAQAEERKAEMLERLDQAVEDGEIDEEQADQIRDRIENGPSFGHRGPGGPGGPGGFGGPGGPGFGPGPGFGGPGGPGFGDPGGGSGGESDGASTATGEAESSSA